MMLSQLEKTRRSTIIVLACLSVSSSVFGMEPGIYSRHCDSFKEIEHSRGGDVQVICYGNNQFDVYIHSPKPHLEHMSREQFRTYINSQKNRNHISVWIKIKDYKTFRCPSLPPDYVDSLKKIYESERSFLLSLGYNRTFVYGLGSSWTLSYIVFEDFYKAEK